MYDLDAIEKALERIEPPFVWRATLRFDEPVSLVFGKKRVVLNPHTAGAREDALAELVKRAKPAAFGVGNETRVDRRVRDGLAIRVADVPFVVDGFDPNASGVVALAKEALMPDDPANLVAELYAVNVYRAGGRFETHKDTPRGEDMLGTLVVCLPWRFEGGELDLSIETGRRRTVLDWAAEIAHDASAAPCAAFFGDVDHAVREVTNGARVTITWLLRRAKAKKKTTAPKRAKKASVSAAADLTALLAELAAEESVAREGLALRFACAHEYAVTPHTPAVRPIVTEDDTHILEGRDGVVARAALAAGLQVSLAYFVWVQDDRDPTVDLRIDEPPTPKKLARLRKLVGRSTLGEEGGFATDFDAELAPPEDLASCVLGYDGASVVMLGNGAYSATGYYGNEASPAAYYVGAALDVVIPRRGAVTAAREINHPKWGPGTVLAVLGEGEEQKYRIRFASGEEKTLLARFVK